ncbi:Carnitine monooxygenase reductase subunit [Paraburkholderia hiiakae]|uniref:Carnitine monooxygenase reductase subunit n=1 Tax=Paraburkholderia hiiakae TaxID=1081782 RepID=A0ABM8NU36_9BURK|nr:PDR/VanB family oxidoreductase [Paraburkholderia hiiakae]CAD6543485.1 Carnitine monooxygenase reductase subunit [Paraburkholderia hiiakae]
MKGPKAIPVRVERVEDITADIRRFTLVPAEGGQLPAYSAGSHVVVTMRGDARTWRNAYSLTKPAGVRDAYQIMVRRVPASRGGSAFMHTQVQEGSRLEISMPSNFFPLARRAGKHVIVAGGIGITPFLSMLPELAASGAHVEVHLCCRPEDAEALGALISDRIVGGVAIYTDVQDSETRFGALLSAQPPGTHLYTCGPAGLMDGLAQLARSLGWPDSHFHQESFGGASHGEPFVAVLAKSGCEVAVGGDQSLLEALEAAGIDAPYMCRGGACGTCALEVLEGEPEHRDFFQSAAERATNCSVLPCVSRARSERLVLNI